MKDHSITNLVARSKRLRIDAELGLVLQCSQCEEWWPANAEFYHRSKRPIGLKDHCRACSADMRKRRAA